MQIYQICRLAHRMPGPSTKVLLVMKLTFFFLTAFLLNAAANGRAQTVTFSGKDVPLTRIFSGIEQQTGYVVFYKKSLLRMAKPVSINVKDMPLEDFFKLVLEDQPLEYLIRKQTVVIREKPPLAYLPQPPQEVTGMVTDSTGLAIEGASIRLRPGNKGTSTNAFGQFRLKDVEPGEYTLEISFIGYQTEVRQIVVGDRARELGRITLKSTRRNLEEVAVINTGYQRVSKERATGSFAQPIKEIFNNRVSTDVISRLNGITSGLVFNANTSATINGKTDINIRGLSTINANDQPLIVVDNFPYSGDLNSINPNDVENVTILKDAGAASVWGARSGNGVIVITTKRGRLNTPLKVTLNANMSILERPDLHRDQRNVSAKDYIELEKFIFDHGGYDRDLNDTYYYTPISPAVEIFAAQRNGTITDAQAQAQLDVLRSKDRMAEQMRYFYRPEMKQQYAIDLQGGTNRSSHYMSLGFDRNALEARFNDYSRFSLNSQNSFRPAKNLELSVGLQYTLSWQNIDRTLERTDGNSSLNYSYITYADENGHHLPITYQYRRSFVDAATSKGFYDWNYVPLDELGNHDNTNNIANLRLTGSIKYTVFKGLSLNADYQYEKFSLRSRNYVRQEAYEARNFVNQYATVVNGMVTEFKNIPPGGILYLGSQERTGHGLRTSIQYLNTFGNHTLDGSVGYEINEVVGASNYSRFLGYNEEYETHAIIDPITMFPTNPNGYGIIGDGLDIGGTIERFRSYYGRAAYTYKNRYTAYANARVDGSNYFGVNTNQKSVPLWSAGVRWGLSGERFYNVSWLPVLNLKASYGYNGNLDKTTTGITTFYYLVISSITNQPYAFITNLGNPDLRWERSRQTNIGMEFGSKNNILTGSLDVYFKKGIDLIGSTPVVPSTGLTSFKGNFSGMKGHGLDLILTSRNIDKAFQWLTTFQFSWTKDEVTKYDVPYQTSQYIYAGGYGSTAMPIVGKPVYSVYSLKWGGLDPENGDPVGYLDGKESKDYNSMIYNTREQDIIFHGSARPVYFGNLSNSFGYRNFNLTLNLTYKLGYYYRRQSVEYNSLFGSFRFHQDYTQRWQQPGDEKKTNVPSLAYPINSPRESYYTYSSVLVEKGDHIRLQDILLSYTLSGRSHATQIFMNASNVGIIWRANRSGTDPDLLVGVPNRMQVSFGIRSNF